MCSPSKYYQQGLTNIVYMGMGEPLLNYANTLRSAERISAEDGLGMSPRRITVSTAGIAKMIRKLADDGARSTSRYRCTLPTTPSATASCRSTSRTRSPN
jgi:adenine C2-methylase RlmN of 23S rRNA A2503 and tRNA A37